MKWFMPDSPVRRFLEALKFACLAVKYFDCTRSNALFRFYCYFIVERLLAYIMSHIICSCHILIERQRLYKILNISRSVVTPDETKWRGLESNGFIITMNYPAAS